MAIELTEQLIAGVGFPVFMVLWFMFRTESVIKKNTEALNTLVNLVGAHLQEAAAEKDKLLELNGKTAFPKN